MKKIDIKSIKYLVVLSGIGCLLGLNSSGLIPKLGMNEAALERGMSKQMMTEAYAREEFEKIYDRSTGTVPIERLQVAYKYAQSSAAKRNRKSPTANLNLQWQERRTRTVLVDKNDVTNKKVWAGSVGGGLWRTNDITVASPAWIASNDLFANLAVTTIAQDPTTPNTMYFGTGEGLYNTDAIQGLGVFKSTDGGTTWAQLAATFTTSSTWKYNQKIVVTAAHTVLAANRAGVYRSADGGATWTAILTGRQGSDLEIGANGSIYASMGSFGTGSDGIYRSDDDGVSFTKIYTAAADEKRIELAVAPSNLNIVYAQVMGIVGVSGMAGYSTNGVSKLMKSSNSTNAAPTWTNLTYPAWSDQCSASIDISRGQGWYDQIMAVSPTDANNVFVGGVDIHHSLDGGTTWQQTTDWSGSGGCGAGYQYAHADQHFFTFVNNTTAYCSNDGGVFGVTNANVAIPTFTNKSNNYNVTQYYAADISPNPCKFDVLAGAQDNGTHTLQSSGIGIGTDRTGGDGGFCHINQSNANVQISSYVYNNYAVTSSNWAGVTYVPNSWNNNTGLFINSTDLDDAQNILYTTEVAGSYGRLIGLTGTPTYSAVALAAIGASKLSAIKVDPNTPNRVWMAVNSGVPTLLKVDNANGVPVSTTYNPTTVSCYISSIDVQLGDANHIIVTSSSYGSTVPHIMESTNGGTSWTNISNNFPDMPARWAIFNPQNPTQALIASELGVWSTDALAGAATQWFSDNAGLANVRTDMIKYRSSDYTLVAATHGRGAYTARLLPQAAYSSIEKTNAAVATGYLGPNQDVYFYTAANKLVARIQNLTSTDYGCTTVSVTRGSSVSTTPISFYHSTDHARFLLPKTVQVTPTTNSTTGSYRIYLYYDPTEITAWQTYSGKTWAGAQIVKCSGNITAITPSATSAGGTAIIQANDGYLTSGLAYISSTFTSTGFSSFGVGVPGSPLPLDLLSFTGKLSGDKGMLNWVTLNELNIAGFEVEHSADTRSFEKIGSASAKGGQNQQGYQLTDPAVRRGIHYYRLKMLDQDGKFTYSNLVSIDFPVKAGLDFAIYPNPVSDRIHVRFNGSEAFNSSTPIRVDLTDVSGRVYLTQTWTELNSNDADLSVSDLPAGVYILTLQQGTDKAVSRKVVKR
jgi:hypothetical protein